MAYVVMAYKVVVYTDMACTDIADIRARKCLRVRVLYGTCTMPIWLTATCPKILVVTLADVFESDNAKHCINLTCSVCARCGDEVLCRGEV